jgi:photosystem II stability/assembly factor-like uncharacterized protein
MMKKYILICYIGIVSQTFGQWVPVDIPSKSSFRALKSLGEEIWAGGTQGSFGHSTDAGKSWKFVQIPGAAKLDFRDLVILNKQEVLLMSAGLSEEGKASIWRTQDAGEHWELVFEKKEPGFFFDCIQWDRSKQEGWLLADPIQRKLTLFQIKDHVFRQIDTPRTPLLQAKEAFFAASGSSLSMIGNHLLLIGGGGAFARIYLKRNQKSGWTYTETTIPTGEAKGYFSIGSKNKKTFWAVGGDYRKSNEGTIPILTTQDGGKSWKELTNTPAFYMEKVIWAKPYWIVSGPSQSAAYHEKKKQWKNLGPSPYHNIIQVGGEIWGIGAKGQLGKISLSSIDKLFLAEK